MIGVDAGGNRTAVMFEFDRTRRSSKQGERLRRYDWFLTVGWRESRYAFLDIEPAVLLVCADEQNISAFVRAARAYLTARLVRSDDRSGLGECVGREQTGFTSRDRLLRADPSVVQPTSTTRGYSTVRLPVAELLRASAP